MLNHVSATWVPPHLSHSSGNHITPLPGQPLPREHSVLLMGLWIWGGDSQLSSPQTSYQQSKASQKDRGQFS